MGFNLRMSKELHAVVKEYAWKSRISMNAAIVKIVEDKMKGENK
jgi:predicted HicB family RNase H-like nuclease